MTLYPTLFGQGSSDEESDSGSNDEELSRSPIILDLRVKHTVTFILMGQIYM